MVPYLEQMNRFFHLFGLFWVVFNGCFCQNTTVLGTVVQVNTSISIAGVRVSLEGTNIRTQTDAQGNFEFSENLPLGEQELILIKEGYESAKFPILIHNNQVLTLNQLFMHPSMMYEDDRYTISLSEEELTNDTSSADNIAGLLQSSQDIFSRTAAFDFGPSFFKVRGLGSDQGIMSINGITMNKFSNHRPQWSNWGGLNDVLRNVEYSSGFKPSVHSFGAPLGSTNISTKASEYPSGGRITYSSSNRSYANRLMATYASGLVKGGWAYAVSVGRRWSEEGYQDATFYDANSFFLSLEKKINNQHSVYLTGIYTPNSRGKSSPNTQEVYDLKNTKYNEYWGYHDQEKRNSRVKRIEEPILFIGHQWQINSGLDLLTNALFQFGSTGNLRLDFANGANPSPAYYQRLPSYALANPNGPDYSQAFLLQEEFTANGQIDWNRIYDANLTNSSMGLDASYVLSEDRNEDQFFAISSALNWKISDRLRLLSKIDYRQLRSHNFALITDMLGGTTYSNVDSFEGTQFDLNRPNSVIQKGDVFRYNYLLEAKQPSVWIQAEGSFGKWDYYGGINFSQTVYRREGLFRNEANSNNSFGKGPEVRFEGIGAKGGFTYKFSGKHIIDFNGAYILRAPSLSNTYTNVRYNHNVVGTNSQGPIPGTASISEEKIQSLDLNYLFRTNLIHARLTAFYSKIMDVNQTSIYYADGLGGFEQTSEFIQEVLQGIDTKHFGIEFGAQGQLTPVVMLNAAVALGNYTFDNNPFLYVASDASTVPVGRTYLKNYKLASGPQSVYSLGMEYRDPKYWWMGLSANLFQNTFIDISPLQRSSNFYTDPRDGLPFIEYDQTIAQKLLKQERFNDYITVNAVGGKSWKIGQRYLGLFISLNNLFNERYRTGGFEQGRSANFRTLLDDLSRPKRLFGPKYWYGQGTTYFVNLNLRF